MTKLISFFMQLISFLMKLSCPLPGASSTSRGSQDTIRMHSDRMGIEDLHKTQAMITGMDSGSDDEWGCIQFGEKMEQEQLDSSCPSSTKPKDTTPMIKNDPEVIQKLKAKINKGITDMWSAKVTLKRGLKEATDTNEGDMLKNKLGNAKFHLNGPMRQPN